MNETDNFQYADAEVILNGITPSLEYYDIDALNNKTILNIVFSLTMKNEALETHCLNDAKLFAFPRKKDEPMYQTSTITFFIYVKTITPSKRQ